jgi:hypothetical protein
LGLEEVFLGAFAIRFPPHLLPALTLARSAEGKIPRLNAMMPRPQLANDGRDSLREAYEEALDLVVYLRKALAEGGMI